MFRQAGRGTSRSARVHRFAGGRSRGGRQGKQGKGTEQGKGGERGRACVAGAELQSAQKGEARAIHRRVLWGNYIMLLRSKTLAPGDRAPDFTLPSSRGDLQSLASYLARGTGAARVSPRHLVTQLPTPVR